MKARAGERRPVSKPASQQASKPAIRSHLAREQSQFARANEPNYKQKAEAAHQLESANKSQSQGKVTSLRPN